jgi:prolipoprotein diacylglyceryltransferase
VAYELLMDLVILGILWRLIGRFRPDGAFVMVYLIMYSVGRFFLSFLRLDSNTVFLTLNQPQWICIVVVVVAVSWLVWRRAAWQTRPALVAEPAVGAAPEGDED